MQRRGCGEVFTLGGSTACLFRTPYGALLENVATEPALRGQGRASRLLNEILRDCEGPVCLLCDPALEGFYARAGFRRARFAGLEPAGK